MVTLVSNVSQLTPPIWITAFACGQKMSTPKLTARIARYLNTSFPLLNFHALRAFVEYVAAKFRRQ